VAKSKGKGDKDVLFRVGVAAHPESKRSLKDLGDSALQIQRNLERSMSLVGRRAKEAADVISKGMASSISAAERSFTSTISGMVATAKAEMESLRRMAAPVKAPTSGVYSPTPVTVGVGAGSRSRGGAGSTAQQVPMSAGEQLAAQVDEWRSTEVSAHKGHMDAVADVRRKSLTEMLESERSQLQKHHSQLQGPGRPPEARRASRTRSSAPTVSDSFDAGMSAAEARRRKLAEDDERRERETNVRQQAAEHEKRKKDLAKSQAAAADQSRESDRQQVQRQANIQTAQRVGVPAGSDQAEKFAQSSLDEQEAVIQRKIKNETSYFTAVGNLQGKDLAEFRKAVQAKAQSLQVLLNETKAAAGQAHAVESTAVQKTLKARQVVITSSIRELLSFDAVLKKQIAAEDAEQERLHSRHRARQLSTAKANRAAREGEAKEVARAAQEADREADRQHGRHRARQLSIAKANRAARDAEAREALAQSRAMESDYSRNVATVNQANAALSNKVMGVAGSIGQATRGFLQLGLVGEESTKDLLEGWIKIQSGFDIIVGGAKVVKGITDATHLWSEANTAAKLAAEIAAAANARHIVSLTAEAQAATAAAAAHGRLATARVAGAGGGAASAATSAATAGSTAVRGAASAGSAGIAGAGAVPAVGGAAITFGAAVAAFVGGAAGILSASSTFKEAAKFGFGGGARQDTIAGKIAEKEASIGVGAIKMLGVENTQSMMRMLSGTLMGLPGKIAGGLGSNPLQPFTQAASDDISADKAVKARERRTANRAFQEEQGGIRADRMRSDFTATDRRRDVTTQLRLDAAPRDNAATRQLKTLQREIDATQRRLADLPDGSKPIARLLEGRIRELSKMQRSVSVAAVSPEIEARKSVNKDSRVESQKELNGLLAQQKQLETKGSDAEKQAVSQRIAEVHQRMLDLGRERLSIEQQIGDERRRANEEAISSLRSEIEMRSQQKRDAEGRVKSAAEAFGEMTLLDQQLAMRAKAKSNAAADKALSPNEKAKFDTLNKKAESPGGLTDAEQANLAQLRQKRTDAAGNALTREERGRLKSLGLSDDVAAASSGARTAAKRAGFDTAFGRDDRTDANIADAARKKLDIELKNKLDFTAKLDANVPAMATAIVNTLLPLVEQIKVDLARQVTEDFRKQMAAANTGANARATQGALARK